jgi:carbon-monoxide dehydrogenase medium subunit
VAQVVVADGCFDDVRVALFGLSDTPVRLPEIEARLRGEEARAETAAAAAAGAGDGIELLSDARVAEDYRRHLAAVVTRRALGEALEGAR